jgi:hypothetical protein
MTNTRWELHLLMGLDIIDVKPPTSAMMVLNCIMRRGIVYLKPCLVKGVVMSVIKARDLLQYFVISFNVCIVQQLLDDYPKCFIVGADNVGSKQMQQIRMSLRGVAVVLMGKNTMMRKAIRGHLERNPALEK